MKKSQKVWLAAVLLFAVGILIGCGDSSTTVTPDNGAKVAKKKEEKG